MNVVNLLPGEVQESVAISQQDADVNSQDFEDKRRPRTINPDGYALTGQQEIEGKWYYFEPRSGNDLECALYVSDQEWTQAIGEFRSQ